MISGNLGYMGKERLQEVRMKIGDVERMLKALTKSLENQPLNPEPLGLFLTTNWEKSLNIYQISVSCEIYTPRSGMPIFSVLQAL